MKMGMSTLQWSADIALPEEAEKSRVNWLTHFQCYLP